MWRGITSAKLTTAPKQILVLPNNEQSTTPIKLCLNDEILHYLLAIRNNIIWVWQP